MSEPMRALPRGWSITKLGDVIDRMSNGANAAQYSEPVGLPITRIETISSGFVDLSRVKHVKENDPDFIKRYALLDGDILFSHINSDPHLGKTAIYHDRFGLLIHGINLLLIRPSRHFSSTFLHYQFQYLRNAGKFISVAQRAVNQSSINQRTLSGFDVLVSPRNEQDRIVAEIEKQFTRVDAATTALKRVQANLKRYRASVLKAACEGRLVPTEAELAHKEGRDYEPADKLLQRILRERRSRWEADTLSKMIASGKPPKDDRWKEKYKEPSAPDVKNLPSIPQGWAVASLEQLTSESRPICYGILMPKENVANGVLFVKVKDMRGDRIELAALHRTTKEIASAYQRASLRTGDVLLAIRGTYGRVAEVPEELDGGNITQDTVRLDVSPLVNRGFVMAHLRSPNAQNYFKRVARGVAVKGVNVADVRTCPILLPPRSEQDAIAPAVELQLSVIDSLQNEVAVALLRGGSLRRSILSDAFSGKLVQQQPEDEPASLLLQRIREEQTDVPRKSRMGRQKEPTFA